MGRKLGEKRKNTVKKDRWEVLICTPAYEGKVDTDFCQSLAESCFAAPLHQVLVNSSVMANGAFIDLARNVYVKIFLEQFPDATHLFFIDSDLKFPPNAFIGLIRAGLPICAGVYRRRQEPEDYPVKWEEHPEMGGLWVTEDGWVMANRVPTGFLCIRRDVIEEMAAEAEQMVIAGQEGTVPRLFYTYLDKDNRFVGEDFAFCDDYMKKYKEPIPVWPDIDFVHGGYECNLLQWLEKTIEADEKIKLEDNTLDIGEAEAV